MTASSLRIHRACARDRVAFPRQGGEAFPLPTAEIERVAEAVLAQARKAARPPRKPTCRRRSGRA